MAEEKPPVDPSQMFQEWVTQWERAVDQFSNQMMGTEEFSRFMNQMQGVQMEMQKNFGEQMARQLATFNMPSRDDILQLSEDVRELDRRVARMEATLNNLVPAGQNDPGMTRRKSPARTRKPPEES